MQIARSAPLHRSARIVNGIIMNEYPFGSNMDAQEWSRMADKLAQIRAQLYKIQENHEEHDTEVYHQVAFIREMLAISLERVDKLASWDDKGWLR